MIGVVDPGTEDWQFDQNLGSTQVQGAPAQQESSRIGENPPDGGQAFTMLSSWYLLPTHPGRVRGTKITTDTRSAVVDPSNAP